MKNMFKKTKKQIDAMAIAKKDKDFWLYSQPAKIKTRFAAKVFQLRKKQGISQQVLAKNIKTSQKVISQIENADVDLGINLLVRVATILNFQDEDWAEIFDCNFRINIIKETESALIKKDYKFSSDFQKRKSEPVISYHN